MSSITGNEEGGLTARRERSAPFAFIGLQYHPENDMMEMEKK